MAAHFRAQKEFGVSTATAKDVAKWLRGLGCKNVLPVCVTIKGKDYQGARYVQQNSVRVFLVGKLPAAWLRSQKTVFRFNWDKRDWYVGTYVTDAALKSHSGMHPFGYTFILFPWDVPSGETIDKYEHKPYTRIPAKIKRVK